jgi:hypothetical protein
MPKIKPKSPPSEKRGTVVTLIEPDRFAAVRQVFADRGYAGLPLSMQVRKLIDEWLEAQKSPPAPKRPAPGFES